MVCMMTEDEFGPVTTMKHQIGHRAKNANERFDYVVSKNPKLMSGKGKYYHLNWVGMKEAYEKAKTECPEAADTILMLLWDICINYNTLQFLEEDFREKEKEKNADS